MKKLIPLLQYGLSFIVLGVLVAILMDQIVMPMYVKHGQKITLPDVRRMQYDKASKLLQDQGFIPVKGDVKYNAEFDPGMVIDQQPYALSTVKSGRRVYLTVANAEPFLNMPELVGQSIRGTKLQLSQVGLQLDSLTWVFSDTFPQDVVTWQSVRPNAPIRRGSGVLLRVSKGKNPNKYQVPDLINLSLEEAKRRLAQSRLTLGDVNYVQDEELIPYTVLKQSVEPGTILYAPQAVNLDVSVLSLNDILNERQRQR